jgi:CRP-like cAMP-binding protein
VNAGELARFALLADLDDAGRAALAGELELLELAPRARLFEAGDPGEGLLLVADGRISLRSERHGAHGEFGPGDALGANSLVSDAPRAACAETLSRARIYRLGRAAFRRFRDAQPRAACRLLEALLREQSRISCEALERFAERAG